MPELPEVETMRRGIAPIVGCRIEGVEALACPRKPIRLAPSLEVLQRRVARAAILGVERAGKRVVVRIDGEQAIVFEPRMTGLVLLAGEPDPLYSRLQFHLSAGAASALLYWDRRGLGSVRLLNAREFERQLGPQVLGPDALDMTGGLYHERLGNRRRPVKTALLDQKATAGIGNIYASELLFLAQIHPETPCCRLSRRGWDRLAAAARSVLEEAIRYEGSTLADGSYRNAFNQQGGYQNVHRVYAREGAPCPKCGAPIRRIVQAQRSTFFCGRCQRRSWKSDPNR